MGFAHALKLDLSAMAAEHDQSFEYLSSCFYHRLPSVNTASRSGQPV